MLKTKNVIIGEIWNDVDAAGRHTVLNQDAVFDEFMDGNDAIGITSAQQFLPFQHFEQEAPFALFEFSGERIGHGIMDIKHHTSAEEFGDERGEYHEIGHVVDMNSSIAATEVEESGFGETTKEEIEIREHISDDSPAPISKLLEVVNADSPHCFHDGIVLPPECDEIDFKASAE